MTAPAPKGSAVLFDVRILHRGLANTEGVRRPQLYISFVQEWFVDHVNFNDKQTRAFDAVPVELRKLLGRVDSKMYIQQLEEAAAAAGVDVKALQST